jgi:hypothetical protein
MQPHMLLVPCLHASVSADGQSLRVVLITYTKLGEPFLVSVAATPLLDEHGKQTYCRWMLQVNPDSTLGMGSAAAVPPPAPGFATASALAAAAAVAARTSGMGAAGLPLGGFGGGGMACVRPEDSLSAALMMGATAGLNLAGLNPAGLNPAALARARLPPLQRASRASPAPPAPPGGLEAAAACCPERTTWPSLAPSGTPWGLRWGTPSAAP